MAGKRKLDTGTKVTTDDGRAGIVIGYESSSSILVNVSAFNGLWPFPTIVTYSRKQLTVIEEEYEEAPF
jgi:hypothetical protein